MHHDDNVRARFERETVTSFLVATVTGVVLMDMDAHAEQLRRHLHRVVAAAVIHEDDLVHNALLEHLIHGHGDSLGGIVSRHDQDDFFSVIHNSLPKSGESCPNGSKMERKSYAEAAEALNKPAVPSSIKRLPTLAAAKFYTNWAV